MPSAGSLYVLRKASFAPSLLKVGMTQLPWHRRRECLLRRYARQLGGADGIQLDLYAPLEHMSVGAVERAVLTGLRPFRFGGEWFHAGALDTLHALLPLYCEPEPCAGDAGSLGAEPGGSGGTPGCVRASVSCVRSSAVSSATGARDPGTPRGGGGGGGWRKLPDGGIARELGLTSSFELGSSHKRLPIPNSFAAALLGHGDHGDHRHGPVAAPLVAVLANAEYSAALRIYPKTARVLGLRQLWADARRHAPACLAPGSTLTLRAEGLGRLGVHLSPPFRDA